MSSVVGSLTIDLALSVLRIQQDVEAARGIVEKGMSAISGYASLAQKALAGIGVGLSIAALEGYFMKVAEGAGHIHDLAISSGMAVEGLSALASVGKFSGQSADDIALAAQRLARNMAGATIESKGAGIALQTLGVDFNTFKNMAPDQQFIAISKALEGYADGQGKVAIMQALYGKTGAQMLPMMKDMAVAGDLQAKITTAQAERAKDFDDQLKRVSTSSEAWKKQLVMAMIPAMDDAAKAFVKVFNGAGGMRQMVGELAADGSIDRWVRNAVTGLTYVADAIEGVITFLKTVGMYLGAMMASSVQSIANLGAAYLKVTKLDFSGAVGELSSGLSAQKAIWTGFGEDLDKLWSKETWGGRMRTAIASVQSVGETAEKTKPRLDFTNILDKDNKEFKSAMEQISKLTAEYSQVANQGGEKLTAGQKLALELLGKLTNGQLKLNEAMKIQLRIALERMLQKEKEAELAERERKANDEAVKAHQELTMDMYKQLDATTKEIEKQKERTAALLSGKEASEGMAAAILEEQAATMQLTAIRKYEKDLDFQLYQVTMDQVDALRQLAAAKRETAQVQDGIKEFSSLFHQFDSVAKQVWDDLWNGGSNTFKKLGQTLKSALIDMLYQLTVKQWIINIAANVTGTSGSIAQAAAGQALGSGSGGLMSLVSNGAGSMFGASGFAGLGTLQSGGAGILGSIGSAFGVGASNAAVGSAAPAIFNAAVDSQAANVALGLSAEAVPLASIGPVGWVALAALAAYSIFGGKSHGPKTEMGNGGPGSPAVGDTAAAEQYANAINMMYGGAATALGLHQVQLQDQGFFASQDPNGTAQTQLEVHSANYDRGSVYGTVENAGRSVTDLKDAIQLSGLQDVFTELQHAIGQEGLTGQLADIVMSVHPLTDSFDVLQAALTKLQTTATNLQNLSMLDSAIAALGPRFSNLAGISAEMATSFANAAGGMSNLTGLMSNFLDKFGTAEEKINLVAANIAAALSNAGLSYTGSDIAAMTRDQYISMVNYEQGLAATDAGAQKAYVALLSVADAFNQIHPAAQVVDDIARVNGSLITWGNNIISLQLPTDTSTSALSQFVQTIITVPGVLNMAGGSISNTMQGLLTESENLTIQLLQAQGKMEEANALIDQMKTAGMTDAEKAIYFQNQQLSQELSAQLALNATSAQHSAGGHKSAAKGHADAAAQMKTTWENLTKSVMDEVGKLRGLITGGTHTATSLAQAQAALMIAQAAAVAGNAAAAAKLPGLADSVAAAALLSTGSKLDYERIISQTANSLQNTGSQLSTKISLDASAVVEQQKVTNEHMKHIREHIKHQRDVIDRWNNTGMPPTRDTVNA